MRSIRCQALPKKSGIGLRALFVADGLLTLAVALLLADGMSTAGIAVVMLVPIVRSAVQYVEAAAVGMKLCCLPGRNQSGLACASGLMKILIGWIE